MAYKEALKQGGDIAAATVTVGTLAQWLPAIAAAFTIIWTVLRIYEMKTIQNIIGKFRKKKK